MMITPFTRNAWVSPLERLYALQREFDRTFEGDASNGSNTWLPPMDVVETADEVLCHLEVPGMSRDDLELRVQDNMLVVSGEKKYEHGPQKEGGFRSVERRYGKFERSISLPRTVDTSNVKARHENGVLTIVLPKMEASKPRRIEIEGASATRELNK
jgi:HSP20 family protein